MRQGKVLARLTALFLAMLLLGAALPSAAADGVLVIGKVSDNPRKHYKRLKPMVDYVAERMGDLGIRRGEVLLAKDNAQMIRYLKEGKVDWVTETAYSSLEYADRAGAEIILLKWKKGVPRYHSVFITRKDSGIDSLDDLKGKRIAFEDPGSTSAYFLPRALLADHGLSLVPLASPREQPPGDKVGYVFAGEEVNLATWVYKGLADAGAYSNLDWDTPDHTPLAIRAQLKIFHASRPFPRAVESVRGDLEPAIRARLIEILTQADKNPAGRRALYAYQKCKKIEPLDEAARAQLQELSRIRQRLQRGP